MTRPCCCLMEIFISYPLEVHNPSKKIIAFSHSTIDLMKKEFNLQENPHPRHFSNGCLVIAFMTTLPYSSVCVLLSDGI